MKPAEKKRLKAELIAQLKAARMEKAEIAAALDFSKDAAEERCAVLEDALKREYSVEEKEEEEIKRGRKRGWKKQKNQFGPPKRKTDIPGDPAEVVCLKCLRKWKSPDKKHLRICPRCTRQNSKLINDFHGNLYPE